MASIILDSSDDDIPDTPENYNIRTMPKTNHLDGKANQFVVRKLFCLNWLTCIVQIFDQNKII